MPDFWARLALRYRNFMQEDLRADLLSVTAAQRETETRIADLAQNIAALRGDIAALRDQADAHRAATREEFFAERNGAHEEFLAQQSHFAIQHQEFQRLHDQREKLETAMARLGDFERVANALESALLTIALQQT